MAIYQIRGDSFDAVPQTTFQAAGIRERDDLQRFLRDRVDVIAPGSLVIAEEFGYWEESRRRIDLLAVDRQGNLVVIELKRTEDGGHMDLQAVRYAAMVSTLTFARAVEIFAAYLTARQDGRDAERTLLDFLEWDEAREDDFANEVRIVLASAEFSKELTSTVLWLAEHGLDISCVRIRPYADADRVLLDVQQVIPLPEAEDYQIRVREKKQEERSVRRSNRDYTRFNVTVGDQVHENLPKRRAIHTVVHELCRSGVSPEQIGEVIDWRTNLFVAVDSEVDSAAFIAAASAEYSGKFDPTRWFIEDNELIHHVGRTYALSNQWGNRTRTAMLKLLETFKPQHITFEKAT
ncbi:Endonuclease NucS [Posidoniimonas corsicana]|uniref:Endonuclease NucS n=1 Tax=Posidoniimonas corsicana TaxID=1938618 RepID=A0A5C5V751_9BACT|nr:hypothetical protein [Posidoniimonas corsicana]TWT33910.1 Endonuclease NucS [Posidoniimonas corsicana]